jgi:hypothetical protein
MSRPSSSKNILVPIDGSDPSFKAACFAYWRRTHVVANNANSPVLLVR